MCSVPLAQQSVNIQKQMRDFLTLTFLSGIGIGMVKVSAPLYAKAMGADAAAIGVLTGVQPLGMMLMSLPVGLMINSVGARKLFVIGSFIGAICFALTAYIQGLLWFLLVSAIASLFMPFRFISVQSDFFQYLLHWGNTKAGWLRATQMSSAFVIGPVIGGYLIASVSFSATYLLIAALFLLSILLAQNVLSNRAEPSTATPLRTEKLTVTLKKLFRHAQLRQALLTEFVVHLTLIYFSIFSVLLAIDKFHFSARSAVGLTGVQGAAFVCMLLFGGALTTPDKTVGYVITSVALLCLGLATHPIVLGLGALLLGLGLGYLTVANLIKLTQLTKELGRGNVAGVNGLVGPSGGLVGSIVGGLLGQYLGLQSVFLILAGVFMFLSVIVLNKQSDAGFFYKSAFSTVFASVIKQAKLFGLAVIVPLFIVLLWSMNTDHHWVAPQVLPTPDKVVNRLAALIEKGDIQHNLAISFWRVLAGLGIGGGIGLLFGIAMGLSKRIEVYFNPLFKAFASVPSLAWVPLAILFFGIGEPLKFFLIASTCAVPVTINTLSGIRSVPVNFLDVGRVYRFSHWQMLRKVIFPAALPPIFAGISLALNQAWQTLVAVELLASSEGIGFMMTWGRQLMQMDVVLATIIVIGVVGFLLDKALQSIESYLTRWQPKTA
jgi:sulfonate transport system permease protein